MAPVLTVVCVNWCNYQGRGAEYVEKLERMVARHLNREHKFVCLTERELGMERTTWWAKIGLFEPGRFSGDTLYFDLDVVISRRLELPELNGTLFALDDFSYPLRSARPLDDPRVKKMFGGLEATINSSVMYWRGDSARKVWDTYTPENVADLHGDQNWITKCLWPDGISLFPDGFARSFKYHGCGMAPITVFHGASKPHHVPDTWVRDHWR